MKSVLLPRFDSLGDVILLEGFLKSALQSIQGLRLTLLVRPGVEQLGPLMPDSIQWSTVDLNPYSQRPSAEHLQALRQRLRLQWDEIWFTAYSKTWADAVVAHCLAEIPQTHLGPFPELDSVSKQLAAGLEIPLGQPEIRTIEVAEKNHELEKLQSFSRAIGISSPPKPRTRVPEGAREWAQSFLRARAWQERSFVICLPGGVANVKCKIWPAEKFAQTVHWLEANWGLKSLLVGDSKEVDIVERVRREARRLGASPEAWIGRTSELPLLAALLQLGRLYVGPDSGPMHLASSLGIPVAAVFGGGTWPRFLPFGPGAVVVREMPCFGCRWSCCFGDAPCIRDLPIETVQSALSFLLEPGEQKTECEIFRAPRYSAESEDLILRAAEVHRRLEQTRSAQLGHLEAVYLESEHDRAARLQVIEAQGGQIARMDAEIAWLNGKIRELERELERPGTDESKSLP